MYKVACTRKEASCIIGSLFGELVPICKKCRQLKEDDIVLETESGLALEIGENLTLEGKSSLSGKPIKIRLTDYGLEFYGDITEIPRQGSEVCLYWLSRQFCKRRLRYSWKGMSTPC